MPEPDSFSAASGMLLECYRASIRVDPASLSASALRLLAQHLQFDGAIWVLDDTTGGQDELLCADGLSRSIADVIRRVLVAGSIAGRSKLRARCIAASLAELPRIDAMEPTSMREAFQRENVAFIVGLRSESLTGEIGQWIVLTRSARHSPFDDDQTHWFELVGDHLMQACAISRRLVDARHGGRSTHRATATATVDTTGRIVGHVGPFAELMRREWPKWSGDRLPSELSSALVDQRHDFATPFRYQGQSILITASRSQNARTLDLHVRTTIDALTPREAQIARRYAEGHSHREIADSLTLAPTTVRAHLRHAYRKLRVTNKIQLAATLRAAD